ncbi:MAG: hydroxyethylthiazole kinase [Zestosphaera tikiterensis]|uniref:Hydroxyethylthiazole kinase n=2 Tax=Zestosphaera tikiterensis TaxID=1973259 RepID=A0A2R7Y406_9CREN|nr:MAG: hydroxyethylthiazole kinase [Zestosphaera tikiterensis]
MGWIAQALDKVRVRRPLVHNITNYVVMNTTANALLALGASPIMAHSPEELEDLIKVADAVVVNIGTLDDRWIYSMVKAVSLAKQYGKPLVLDPVGAGATKLRTSTAFTLLSVGGVKIVRGNFGEVSALLGVEGRTKGVEASTYDVKTAAELALETSKKFKVVTAVSGPTDFVSDGTEVYEVRLRNKSERLEGVIGRVTGLGCIVTALIGAFAAVEDPLKAAVAGFATFKAVALKSSEEAAYPGTFHVKLYDWLYRVDEEVINEVVEVRSF